MPYGIALPSSLSGKSCTLTRTGEPWGWYSRPPLWNSPTSSFFLVSTLTTGAPVDVLAALGDLGVGLQAEPLGAQHPRDRPVRHPMPAAGQRVGQVAGRL